MFQYNEFRTNKLIFNEAATKFKSYIEAEF